MPSYLSDPVITFMTSSLISLQIIDDAHSAWRTPLLVEALLELVESIHGSAGLVLIFALELRDPDDIADSAQESEERNQPPDES